MKSLFTAIFIISPSFVSYPVLSKMQLPFFSPIVLVYEKIGEKINKIKHVCKHNLFELCGEIKYYITNVYSSSD
jgi:hypothetical protein